MKAIGQYVHVVLFTMLYKVVLTFTYVDETLVCDHSNESYWAVLSCGTVYDALQGGSNLYVCGWNPGVWPFTWKLLSSFRVVLIYYAIQGGSIFWIVDETLVCDHSNESYWAVLSCDAIYYAVHGDSNF